MACYLKNEPVIFDEKIEKTIAEQRSEVKAETVVETESTKEPTAKQVKVADEAIRKLLFKNELYTDVKEKQKIQGIVKKKTAKLLSYEEMVEKLQPGICVLEVLMEKDRKEIESIAEMVSRIKKKDFTEKVSCIL